MSELPVGPTVQQLKLTLVFQRSTLSNMPTALIMFPFVKMSTAKLLRPHTALSQFADLSTTRMVTRVGLQL